MTASLLFLFATGTLFWLIYWSLVRPLILDSAVDELRRMRSALDWAIIEGQPGSTTEAAQELSKHLEYCRAVRRHSLSQAIVLGYLSRAEIQAEIVRRRKIFNEGPAWIRDMFNREKEVCMKAALANSPAWWIPLAMILLGSFFSLKLRNWWEQTGAAADKLKCELTV